MKIAITGATGFVGANLVRHFARRGDEVLAIGRGEPPAALLRFAKYMRADIRHPLPSLEADAVVHAAALADDHAGENALHEANVTGTKHVRQAARKCSVFVQVSSSSVYVPQSSDIKEEEVAKDNLLSRYGRSKRAADDWLLAQTVDNQRLCILRPRAVYGIGDRVLLPKLLRLLVANRLALLPGQLAATTSMTHVGNLCHAVERCIAAGATGVFNVADAEPYRLRAVFEALLRKMGKDVRFVQLPEWAITASLRLKAALGIRAGLSVQAWQYLTEDVVLDIAKAKNELDYQLNGSFFTQLDALAEWVAQVGKHRVASADRQLPWLGF
jgi:nucleoside-diphosphate-sugar epimerase